MSTKTIYDVYAVKWLKESGFIRMSSYYQNPLWFEVETFPEATIISPPKTMMVRKIGDHFYAEKGTMLLCLDSKNLVPSLTFSLLGIETRWTKPNFLDDIHLCLFGINVAVAHPTRPAYFDLMENRQRLETLRGIVYKGEYRWRPEVESYIKILKNNNEIHNAATERHQKMIDLKDIVVNYDLSQTNIHGDRVPFPIQHTWKGLEDLIPIRGKIDEVNVPRLAKELTAEDMVKIQETFSQEILSENSELAKFINNNPLTEKVRYAMALLTAEEKAVNLLSLYNDEYELEHWDNVRELRGFLKDVGYEVVDGFDPGDPARITPLLS